MTVRVAKPASNLREKLSELDKPVGLKGSELMRSDTVQDARDLIGSGRKNIIINGDFRIAQRATTNNTAGAQSTYHTLDRWMTQIQSGTITESQQSLSSSDTGPWEKGFRKYMRILNQSGIGAGAAQYAEIDQRVEAQNIAQSGWDYTSSSSYITLSFWIRASVAQNYIVNMYANDGTNRHFPFQVPLNANTWTKVTKSIPGFTGITIDNDNGNGITIAFIAAYGTNYTSNSGYFDTWNTTGGGTNRWPDMTTTWSTTTNATFDITGVQLEVGSQATPFEHRSYEEELELCRRYYQVLVDQDGTGSQKSFGIACAFSSTSMHSVHLLSPEMRITPTLDYTTGSNYYKAYYNNTSDHYDQMSLVGNSHPRAADLMVSSGLSVTQGNAVLLRTTNNDARIAFSAEL